MQLPVPWPLTMLSCALQQAGWLSFNSLLCHYCYRHVLIGDGEIGIKFYLRRCRNRKPRFRAPFRTCQSSPTPTAASGGNLRRRACAPFEKTTWNSAASGSCDMRCAVRRPLVRRMHGSSNCSRHSSHVRPLDRLDVGLAAEFQVGRSVV
jgi:hypothetical protein